MRKLPDTKFLLDRFIGEEAQTYVKKGFESWGYTVKEMPQGYHPEWDLHCEKFKDGIPNSFTVEIKWDRQYDKYGNVCIEWDGVDHSRADVFTFCLGDPIKAILLCYRESLKAYIHSREAQQYVREVGQLKGRPNYAVVMPEPLFLKAFPGIKKLEVPDTRYQVTAPPKRDFQQEMTLFTKHTVEKEIPQAA